MNNSSMRFYTLASCSGLLALTACGGQEATTPPTQPTQSANTPPPKINLRSQSVIPLPRSASGPELFPATLVRSRAIALTGGKSPFTDQEIQARLQQARLKREQLVKTRLAQLDAQRGQLASSTVTILPERPLNLNPNLPKPLIPAPPFSSTAQKVARTPAVSPLPTQAAARTLGPVAHVSGTSPEIASLPAALAVSPTITSSACPRLVQPALTQPGLAPVKPAPAAQQTSAPGNGELPSPQLQSPGPAMDGALATPYHQSYSLTRGTFPCLTATRLPSQEMRLHSKVLDQNQQSPSLTQPSSLSLPDQSSGVPLWRLLGFKAPSPNQEQATDRSQSALASPEAGRYTPGFSSSSQAKLGAVPPVAPDQGG